MAISTPTTVELNGDTANATAYTTGAVTLTAGRLYKLQLAGYRSGGGVAVTSVIHDTAGTPLNFTLISDGATSAQLLGYDTGSRRAIEEWYVIPASTTASAVITITWSAGQSACDWHLVEIASGFDPTGGSTTFPQVKTATAGGTPGTAIAVTMGAFGSSDSLTALAMIWGVGTTPPTGITVSPTEGRTELGEQIGERDASGFHYQNPNGSDTSIGATLSGAGSEWGAIGIEIAALAGNTTDDVLIRFGSMTDTTGSGLATADWTPGAPTVVYSGWFIRRRKLSDLTGFDDV